MLFEIELVRLCIVRLDRLCIVGLHIVRCIYY